jgi:hypothetical protein
MPDEQLVPALMRDVGEIERVQLERALARPVRLLAAPFRRFRADAYSLR